MIVSKGIPTHVEGTIAADNSARISVAARVPAATRRPSQRQTSDAVAERSAPHTVIPDIPHGRPRKSDAARGPKKSRATKRSRDC